MNRQDFINRLRAALNGNVAPNVVAENVNYYDEYIAAEIRSGKSEAEVLGMLGDPRLIAKTIIDTNPWNGQGGYQEAGGNESDQTYRQAQYVQSANNLKVSRIPGWLWTIISIVIIAAVISLVLSVLSFLAPVILTIAVVMFLVKLFRDWLN